MRFARLSLVAILTLPTVSGFAVIRAPTTAIERREPTPNQREYIHALQDDEARIVLVNAIAGSGKTFWALKYAVESLRHGKYRKVVLTRPNVATDHEHGFLPGELGAKMGPLVEHMHVIMREELREDPLIIKKLLEERTIEILSLNYVRGFTFRDTCLIADECQNISAVAMKALLTRIGRGSKFVILGDNDQTDLERPEQNGLEDFLRRYEAHGAHNSIRVVKLGASDIKRDATVLRVLDVYKHGGS